MDFFILDPKLGEGDGRGGAVGVHLPSSCIKYYSLIIIKIFHKHTHLHFRIKPQRFRGTKKYIFTPLLEKKQKFYYDKCRQTI